jgi:hypothetical protein
LSWNFLLQTKRCPLVQRFKLYEQIHSLSLHFPWLPEFPPSPLGFAFVAGVGSSPSGCVHTKVPPYYNSFWFHLNHHLSFGISRSAPATVLSSLPVGPHGAGNTFSIMS